MKKVLLNRIALYCCAASVVLSAGCTAKPSEAPVEASALSVKVETPTRGDLALNAAFTGRIQPDESVAVIPKLPGEVLATYFDVGDTVKAGEVLFAIDATEVELAVKQAEAGVRTAEAGLKSVQASVAQATGSTYESQVLQSESALKQAQSAKKWTDDTYGIYDDSYDATAGRMRKGIQQAQQGYDSFRALYTVVKALPVDSGKVMLSPELAAGLHALHSTLTTTVTVKTDADGKNPYITEADVTTLNEDLGKVKLQVSGAQESYDNFIDSYETQYNQLTQGLEKSEIGVDTAQKAYDLVKGKAHDELVASMQAQLEQVQAQVEQAKAGYDTAVQKLSYAKVSSPISGVIEQKNISANGMASQSSPAYVVSDKGSLSVIFNVPASAIQTLALGDLVVIESGKKTYSAQVVEIANAINPQNGLFPVKALLAGDTQGLLSGMSVKLTAATAKADDALLIPVSTLYYDNGAPYVYVVKDNVAVKTPIETGVLSADVAQVVAGLEPDAQIVTSWSPKLVDGIAVAIAAGQGE